MRRITRVFTVAAVASTAGYGISNSGPAVESAGHLNSGTTGVVSGDSAWGRAVPPRTGPL